MKIVLTYVALSIAVFACNNRPVVSSKSNKPNPEAKEQFTLKGTWQIKKYLFASIRAMDERMADEWLNKQLLIGDEMYFDFQKIPSYKELFDNVNACSVLNANKPDIVSSEDYFDLSIDPLAELNIKTDKVAVYKTSCTDHPFSELILNDRNELIIRWDGVFFILKKVG